MKIDIHNYPQRIEGAIKSVNKAKISARNKELIKRNFFRAEDLTPIKRERFIKEYGYRHNPFITIEGKGGNNLIIRNDPRKESDYHFCMKHMFAELGNSIMEYSVNGMRTDILFNKIAVEIETGKNKQIAIAKKVKWLNKNFKYWIFICARKNKKLYRKYANNEKSYCLTLKQAYSKVKELIGKK